MWRDRQIVMWAINSFSNIFSSRVGVSVLSVNSPEIKSILYVVYLPHLTEIIIYFSFLTLARGDYFLLQVNPRWKRQRTTGRTWTLCTSSIACESFWSASRMRSVSLWMMTSSGPCSSRGWLRSSWRERTAMGQEACPKTERHPDNHLLHLVMVYLGNIIM